MIETRDEGRVRVVTFLNPPVNAMSPGLPGAVIGALRGAGADGAGAVLLLPGGEGGLAGADIAMQGKPWPAGEPKLTDLVAAIGASPVPVAILLRRFALGGGLEIALACRWRIATPDVRLGQTELRLGIPPGAGGTQLLPRVVGVGAALDLILSAREVTGTEAAALGLVDHLVTSPDPAAQAAAFLAQELAAGRIPPPTGARPVPPADPAVFAAARADAAKKRRGETAPEAAIAAIEAATRHPLAEGLAEERRLFTACVSSPQAAALRHVFFAERSALKGHGVDDVTPRPVGTVAILGAGTMGTGIALACLGAGLSVRLIDPAPEGLSRGGKRIADTLAEQAAKGRITSAEATARKSRLTTSPATEDAAGADLVIEAVFEDIAVKRRVFADLARLTPPGTILATNTSYLDLDAIAEAAGDRRGDVLGLHFFSPAHIMPLLEIVRGQATSPTTLATALALARRLRKTGIVARVCPGFIANRSFEPYTREAEFLLQEGATPAGVDAALTAFGLPMGPFAVRDLAGLDIGWARRKSVAHLRDPGRRYSTVGDQLCEAGWFGQKTGKGFYIYAPGSRTPQENPDLAALVAATARDAGIAPRRIGAEEIVERCLYAVINEAARIVDDGTARRAADVDLAWIHGYGFPRWRGGPLHWADHVGLPKVLARIRDFGRTNDHWDPAPLLVRLAETGGRFGGGRE
ncbi:MAG: 3-hydroxyacyl-CoA dehydrogenase NAD-binding domain-containing protein [Paracoccaceae bacterium]